MKTFYACEICGNSSGDPQQIERCERQGRRNKYDLRQRVVFSETYQKDCETTAQGEVTGIYFKVKTHAIIYEILSKGKKLRIGENRVRGLAAD